MPVQHPQRVRIAWIFAVLLRRSHAQPVAQGLQQHIIDRTLAMPGQRLDALCQQTIDVLHDQVRHQRHATLHLPFAENVAHPA
jgi:hypothetical protein